MKTKIKKVFKNFINYTLSSEFKAIIVIVLLICLAYSLLYSSIMNSATREMSLTIEEQTKKINTLNNEINSLKEQNEIILFRNSYLKSYNEELYEAFKECEGKKACIEAAYIDDIQNYSSEVELYD